VATSLVLGSKVDQDPKGDTVSEHEHRSEEEVLAEQAADDVDDLEVPEGQAADVGGGAWPTKWEEEK
jgi:hypothetical protein